MDSASLGFVVLSYSGVALVALALLAARRRGAWAGRAELGGPRGAARATAAALVALWVGYVGMAALQAYGVINPGF